MSKYKEIFPGAFTMGNVVAGFLAILSAFEGKISDASVWADKKKLFFPLKRFTSGLYYLVNCVSPAHAISRMSHEFRLNEGILRFMFTSL